MMLGLDLTKFTAIERRIFDLLVDGRVHPFREICGCIDPDDPDLCSRNNVKVRMHYLRKKIADRGLMISYVITNGRRRYDRGYQMSRRLSAE